LGFIPKTYLHLNMDLRGPVRYEDGSECALGEGLELVAELPCESVPQAGRYNVEHMGVHTEPDE
jgi:hypothetical protein